MLNKFVLSCAALCFAATVASAQMPCSADEHYHELLAHYPQLAEFEKQFNAQVANKTARITAGVDTTTYDIPMVVHVIHDYGAENVSDNTIYEAVKYWSTVYTKQNADTADVIAPFKQWIGNPRMRLHLATKDPNGQPTKGVVRYNSYLTSNADDGAKFTPWPQNKYINIWLINAFGASSAGAAAYAYYPSTAAYMPQYDGVICLASYTNYAKTIPHELGHVLNLSHVWGSTNNPDVACGDDGVDDTPPTKGHNPTGCVGSALYDTTCATGYSKMYVSASGTLDSFVNYPDTVNAQNIMDYTYCEEMFTKGQAARMRTALTSATAGRNNLITATNLAATGALAEFPDLPPVADYIMGKAVGAGIIADNRSYFLTFNNAGSFQFRNSSWNDTISSIAWTFSNSATNPTSTAATVTNKFAQPGWVTVTLVANSNAGSDTLVDTHAVYAADTTTVPAGSMQSFASESDLNNWPMFNFYNNQFKWEYYTGAGLGDNSCVRYRSFDTSDRETGTAVGDHDDLYTPAYNLAGITDDVYLNFFTSAASTNHGLSSWITHKGDSLEIDVSTNGGARWTKLVGYNSTALVNNGTKNTEFIPSSDGQWKPRAINIPAAYRTNNTFFRFRYLPGNTGNDLYLDNVYIYGFPAGVKEAMATDASFSVYPNPASNGCNMVFKTGTTGNVNYSIRDLAGREIFKAQKVLTGNSVQQIEIPRSITPVAGMYFVTLTVDGASQTQKLIVY